MVFPSELAKQPPLSYTHTSTCQVNHLAVPMLRFPAPLHCIVPMPPEPSTLALHCYQAHSMTLAWLTHSKRMAITQAYAWLTPPASRCASASIDHWSLRRPERYAAHLRMAHAMEYHKRTYYEDAKVIARQLPSEGESYLPNGPGAYPLFDHPMGSAGAHSRRHVP